ncbi:mannose-1-phosphate guanylyltransferase/mannose-6-phosphate isomerase [Tistrella mobilis]|uniref:mannose-1-phosphate guanylyltransferase/mannose-6-phosphate isomerase n=2 Tax=Tistrella mobilis TaxID=171437 RepID=UPI003555C869
MLMTTNLITPVILCGGGGTRLWPLSRKSLPKQFLPLVSSGTMLQETLRRVSGEIFGAPILVCNEEHRFLVAQQAQAIGIVPAAIILEPVGRNTAAAVAVAARQAIEVDAEALIMVLPSDHVVTLPDALRAAVAHAAPYARDGRLVTFGIEPVRPETGYGYIEAGESLGEGVRTIRRFHEKPAQDVAEGYLAAGNFSWNSGMFLFRAATVLDEINAHAPAVGEGVAAAFAARTHDLDFIRLPKDLFAALPDVSIDVAVMEKTPVGAVVPANLGWSDVGTWDALWSIADKDEAGTATVGDVLAEQTSNCYLRSDGPLLAAIGVEDLVVVCARDAVLVASRHHAQLVKTVVGRLNALQRSEGENGVLTYRPWGNYRSIDMGDRFQVKRIVVEPGQKLSLQMHHHRAEHWIVVSGTAEVTCDDKVFILNENQSTYIPLGATHRLANPGKIPLHLIEVQSGAYLGEDDIVRFADEFGRT